MGLGLSLAIVSGVGVSTVTGVAQGVSEQKKQNADAGNQARMLKFHLDVVVDPGVRKPGTKHLHGGIVTLHDDKLWIEEQDPETRQPRDEHRHPFTGFYIAYPDNDRPYTRGLVSTISRDPPMLNWIYVDKDTLECKYASRSGSIEHHVGSYDWTTEEAENSCVTLDEFEGFVAVDEGGGKGWAIYFDMNDDGLKSVKKGRKTCEVSLMRRLLTAQETNKWGLKEEGNIGFKKTREV